MPQGSWSLRNCKSKGTDSPSKAFTCREWKTRPAKACQRKIWGVQGIRAGGLELVYLGSSCFTCAPVPKLNLQATVSCGYRGDPSNHKPTYTERTVNVPTIVAISGLKQPGSQRVSSVLSCRGAKELFTTVPSGVEGGGSRHCDSVSATRIDPTGPASSQVSDTTSRAGGLNIANEQDLCEMVCKIRIIFGEPKAGRDQTIHFSLTQKGLHNQSMPKSCNDSQTRSLPTSNAQPSCS